MKRLLGGEEKQAMESIKRSTAAIEELLREAGQATAGVL